MQRRYYKQPRRKIPSLGAAGALALMFAAGLNPDVGGKIIWQPTDNAPLVWWSSPDSNAQPPAWAQVLPAFATVFKVAGDTSFADPGNWNDANNRIECIGRGGNGSPGSGTTRGGPGAGGGAYASRINVALLANGDFPVTLAVGSTSSAVKTSFNAAHAGREVVADFGTNASTTAIGTGGTVANSIPNTALSGGNGSVAGGNGGPRPGTSTPPGAGGGGAGGPNGAGTTGGASTATTGGDGGNADGGTVAGPTGNTGAGVAGDPGNHGTEWDATHGSGTGGSGGGTTSGTLGGVGGTYGGGAAGNTGSGGAGQAGGAGLIAITWQISGSATLDAAGTIALGSVKLLVASIPLAAVGGFAVDPVHTPVGSASLSGVGSISVDAIHPLSDAPTLSAIGALSCDAVKVSAAITAEGELDGVGTMAADSRAQDARFFDIGHAQSASASQLVITTTADVPLGGSIVVLCGKSNSATVSSVQDDAGNNYDLAQNTTQAPGSVVATAHACLFLAAGSHITVNYSAGASPRGATAIGSSASITDVADRVPARTTGTGTSSSIATGVLAQASELVIDVLTSASDFGAFAPGDNLTGPLGGTTANIFIRPMVLIVASTASVALPDAWANSVTYDHRTATYPWQAGLTIPASTTLAGVAGLSCDAQVPFNAQTASAELDGAGVVSVNGVHTPLAACTLAAVASLSVDAAHPINAASALNGTGSLSVDAIRQTFASAQLGGLGELGWRGEHPLPIIAHGDATLAASSSLAVDAIHTPLVSVTLSGIAAFAPNLVTLPKVGSATLDGVATLTANARIGTASATLAGVGGVSVDTTVLGKQFGSATLSAVGGVSLRSVTIRVASIPLAGAGTTNLGPITIRAAAASIGPLAGSGSLSPQEVVRLLARGTLAGTGGVVADASVPTLQGSATLSGAATLRADAVHQPAASATLQAAGGASAGSVHRPFGEAELDGQGGVGLDARHPVFGSAKLSGTASLGAVASGAIDAVLHGTSALRAEAHRIEFDTAFLSGVATLSADALAAEITYAVDAAANDGPRFAATARDAA